MITEEQAIGIAEAHHGPGFKLSGVHHGIPQDCVIYGADKWTPDHIWCVRCSSHPGNDMIMAPSRAIVICKDTGKILFDGSAGDEG